MMNEQQEKAMIKAMVAEIRTRGSGQIRSGDLGSIVLRIMEYADALGERETWNGSKKSQFATDLMRACLEEMEVELNTWMDAAIEKIDWPGPDALVEIPLMTIAHAIVPRAILWLTPSILSAVTKATKRGILVNIGRYVALPRIQESTLTLKGVCPVHGTVTVTASDTTPPAPPPPPTVSVATHITEPDPEPESNDEDTEGDDEP